MPKFYMIIIKVLKIIVIINRNNDNNNKKGIKITKNVKKKFFINKNLNIKI